MASVAAIDQAIIARLSSDAALAALAPGGVFRETAPQGATTPFVIVEGMTHRDEYAIGSSAYEELIYLVKGIAQSTSGTSAQSIADRVQALLHGVTLTITGYRAMLVQREERVAYVEIDDESDRRWQHRGALYRVFAEAVS